MGVIEHCDQYVTGDLMGRVDDRGGSEGAQNAVEKFKLMTFRLGKKWGVFRKEVCVVENIVKKVTE